MSVLPSPGPVGRRILTPYVLVWVAAAGLATVYLALLGLQPDFFARFAQDNSDVEQQLTETKRDMTRAFADLDPLKSTVGEMRLDVANLKMAAKESLARDADLEGRVSALESGSRRPEVARIGEATTASASAAPPPPAPTRAPREAAASEPAPGPVKVVPPLPSGPAPKDAQVINGAPKRAAPIETSSIEGSEANAQAPNTPAPKTQAAKTQVAVVKPPKPAAAAKPAPVGVLLATGPSVDALRLNWSILTDRHADSVKNLQPRYIIGGSTDQRTYSLVAGPIGSTEKAKSLCQAMAQKGLSCEVSAFRGNAL